MTSTKGILRGSLRVRALVVLVICGAVSSLSAQSGGPYTQILAGDKTVYIYSSSQGGYVYTNSHAYIDAYAAISNTNPTADVCTAIQAALTNLATYTNYTGEGAVIDARGVGPGTTQTCSATANLWNGSTNYPVVVLLPAGTIKTSYTWQLPSGTKLIGEGIGGSGQGTTIQATTGFGWMIQMGLASGCTGLTVENLTLDGNEITTGSGVSGILNQYCGDLSYVDHVWLYRILGTGLTVAPSPSTGAGAEHSGPYSDIMFNTADAATPSTTLCMQITANYTHGIRHVSCTTQHLSGVPATAIAVCVTTIPFPCTSLTNLLLEDIRIEGFEDGIVLGSGTSSVVLRNIDGDTNGVSNTAPTVNVVDIPTCTNIFDIAMIGIGNQGTVGTGVSNYTINDTCGATSLTDASVALYVAGRPSTSGLGYSRFTTSPNTASWSTGSGVPSGSARTCQRGSLYSNVASNSAAPSAFWVCTLNSSGNTQWLAPGAQ